MIQTDKFSAALRKRGIDLEQHRILVTRYDGSKQESDFTLPANCGGWGRVHHFHRSQGEDWLPNPLPIDPACKWLRVPHADSIQAQVFQNAICSWRCWYCFVDFRLLSADPKSSGFKSVYELLDLYLGESDRPSLIDLSGGQPDLVPEWVLWFADALSERGLAGEVYLWSDDNLSNDYLWKYLSENEVRRLAEYPNYGRVGCFKGFDSASFAFNTQAEPSGFARQFELMRRIVDAGFDVYGYATFTAATDRGLSLQMSEFVDRLQETVHPVFPLRLVPLQIRAFTPTQQRLTPEREHSLTIQNMAIHAWTEELNRRFPKNVRERRIFEHELS